MGRCRISCEIVLYKIRPARGPCTDNWNKHRQGKIPVAIIEGHH